MVNYHREAAVEARKAFASAWEKIQETNAMHQIGMSRLTDEQYKYLEHQAEILYEILSELDYYLNGVSYETRETDGRLDLEKPSGRFIVECMGAKYMYIRVRRKEAPEGGWARFGPPCRSICGVNYRRPHFTCLRLCWGSKVWYGDMPPVFRVDDDVLLTYPYRPAWKKTLYKKAMSVLEWLAS